MRIKYLELNNIGLYKNERLTFQTENEKDVIFIWGNNGAGKTTFINSIKIGLLGNKAFPLEYSDYCKMILSKIISSRADLHNDGASIKICFELKIDNKKKEYIIKRTWRTDSDILEESVNIFDKNGIVMSFEEQETITNLIEETIPPSVLDVIVFDGENIIKILSDDNMNDLIKGIVHSIFGMDVYIKLSKDLNQYLKSAKSDDSITPQEQIELFELESEYKALLKRTSQLEDRYKTEEQKRIAWLQKTQTIANRFSKKVGISVEDIYDFNEGLTDILNKKEEKDSEIRYINEEIIPFKIVQSKLYKILEIVEKERSSKIVSSLKNLKEYFANSSEAIQRIQFLESLIPEADSTIKYDLSEEEYKKLKNLLSTLDRYPKKVLMNNLVEKSDYLARLKDKLAVAVKVEDEESKTMLEELEKDYSELDVIKRNILDYKEEFDKTDKLLQEARKKYDAFKNKLIEKKKTSNSYTTILSYKDAIDYFVSENIEKICNELNNRVQNELNRIHFRNDSISRVQISPKTYEMKLYEKNGKIIPSSLFSAGEKQVLLGFVLKEAVSFSYIDSFFLFDTPVGRLDSKNRKIFTNEVIFDVSDQTFVFATDSDYSEKDYKLIKNQITKEFILDRNEEDEIIMDQKTMY